MWWRLLSVVALLAPCVIGFDFFNCSQVEVCSELRDRTISPKESFSATLESASYSNNVATIPLTNGNNQKLNLVITLLAGRMARVIVEEVGSKRYKLGNLVIENQPKVLEIDTTNVDKTTKTLKITPKDKTNQHDYHVVVERGAPFKVKFYQKTEVAVVLNADQLLMNQGDNEWYTFKVEFEKARNLFGLSYHPDNMTLRETVGKEIDPYRMKNNDAWGHKAYTTQSLYGSIPVIYGQNEQRTYGIFLHNAAEQWVDIKYTKPASSSGGSAYFMVERGALDLYILFGPQPNSVFRQLVMLTGKSHLPQLWTLGYHQCRFSYHSQDEVIEVVQKMDEYQFPFDAIWLDGDHANYSKWFQFNETTYPEPAAMQKVIGDTGRVCVSISDPHIKVEDTYPVYAGGKGKYFIKNKDGSDYEDDCWPGLSTWIDFLNPEARKYYASWYAFDKFNGSTPVLAGIWNDMNEPAVFNEKLEKTAPVDALLNGNVAHGNIHNIYGFLQTMATHDALMTRDKGKKRPFVLTRSHFAGSQRYAAMWTGDNSATWAHLKMTYPQCMTSNLGGMVFCGADIGGFIGDPDDELLQRWYQSAVWTPFFRGHSSRESKRREPYVNENIMENLKSAIRLRYQHIPTWYTAFYEYIKNTEPIIRPVFYNYPSVTKSYDHQLILGTDIMAISISEPKISTVPVFFPGTDKWYRIDDGSWTSNYKPGVINPVALTMASSPVFYRAGSIITRQDAVVRHTGDMKNLAINIYVNLDANNAATGTYYMDDYVSFNYEKNKSYLYVKLEYLKSNGLKIRTIDGNSTGFAPKFHSITVHNLYNNNLGNGLNEMIHTETRDGRPIRDIDIAEELRKSPDNSFVIAL